MFRTHALLKTLQELYFTHNKIQSPYNDFKVLHELGPCHVSDHLSYCSPLAQSILVTLATRVLPMHQAQSCLEASGLFSELGWILTQVSAWLVLFVPLFKSLLNCPFIIGLSPSQCMRQHLFPIGHSLPFSRAFPNKVQIC